MGHGQREVIINHLDRAAAYPRRKKLEKDRLAFGEFVIVVGRQTRHVVGHAGGQQQCEGGAFHHRGGRHGVAWLRFDRFVGELWLCGSP